MSARQVILIVIAMGAAITAGILAKGFIGVKPEKEVVQVTTDTVKKNDVLVADKDIAIGQKLLSGTLRWQSWPADSVVPEMITRDAHPEALTSMESARARVGIFTGEPILDKKILLSDKAGFMSSMIPQGMRAKSIAISDQSSAGGFILPNDRVDVIMTRTREDPNGGSEKLHISEVVLTNVRVLAVNQILKVNDDGVAIPEGKNATLEIKPDQAVLLSTAESAGELSLALMSLAENDDPTLIAAGPMVPEKTAKKGADQIFYMRYGYGSKSWNQ